MDFFSVLESILEQVGLLQFASASLIIFAIYYFLFRLTVRSVLDPLSYVLVFSSFTVILLTILMQLNVIALGKYVFSISTLALFYGAFLLTSARSKKVYRAGSRQGRQRSASASLKVLFFTNLLLLGITYAFFGIPLFLESRLSLWTNSGGFGVIGRLTGGLEFISLLMGLIAARQPARQRRWGIALVAQFIIAAILSGSKGSLMSLVFAWYLSSVQVARTWNVETRLSRRSIVILAVLAALPLLTITIQSNGAASSLGAALQLYATRFAAEGDGYVYFFGDNLIDSIARIDYLALLRPALTGLRLAPSDTAINPGFEVMSQILSIDSPNAGPNSRLPIYILYFYGSAGLILAPLLGMLLGLARNAVVRASARSLYAYALAGSIYVLCTKLEVDPQITVNGLFNMLLVMPIIWLSRVAGSRRTRRPLREVRDEASRLRGLTLGRSEPA